jgi:hypothetical protein
LSKNADMDAQDEETIFRVSSPGLTVDLYLSGQKVIGIGNRGTVQCDNGTRHHQLFAEGVPSLHGFPRLNRQGKFHYREYAPYVDGFPASFEGMRGRLVGGGIRGRIRFWEQAIPSRGRPGVRCGTGSPAGKWVAFFAPRSGKRETRRPPLPSIQPERHRLPCRTGGWNPPLKVRIPRAESACSWAEMRLCDAKSPHSTLGC